MNKLNFSKWWLLLGVLVFLAMSLFVQRKNTGVVAVSFGQPGSSGLTILSELGAQAGAAKIVLKKSPFLESEELKDIRVLYILSPQTPLSKREIGVLQDFVTAGGKLLLSFHNRESWEMIFPILKGAGALPSVDENPLYKSGETVSVLADHSASLFDKGKTYSFYSSLVFAVGNCADPIIDCYVQTRVLGSGEIYVLSGLPPFANGLIHLLDNKFTALKTLEHPGSIMIDEFRHFYSDHTWSHLFKEPKFFIPVIGMLICILLYFLFGSTRYEIAFKATQENSPTRSLHDLNERILTRALLSDKNHGYALSQLVSYIGRQFPFHRAEAEKMARDYIFDAVKFEDLKTFENEFHRTVALHKKWRDERIGGIN